MNYADYLNPYGTGGYNIRPRFANYNGTVPFGQKASNVMEDMYMPIAVNQPVANPPSDYRYAPMTPGIPAMPVEEQDPSLTSAVLGGSAFMGPIMARHIIAHPINSFKAMVETNKIFAKLMKSRAFKAMSPVEQAKIYNVLFRKAQVSPQILKAGLRTAKETNTIKQALAGAQKGLVKALKAGDSVKAAEEAAKITKISETGGKSILPFVKVKSAKTVVDAANTAGTAAAQAASATAATTAAATAKASAEIAAATTKGAKAVAMGKSALIWSKDALKVGGAGLFAVIEGACELPEVYGAFSKGGFGEGVAQTAKSSVKVGASVSGWCLGAKGGASVGAMIGTAVCPGVGTAIGSALGLIVGGIGGSWITGKIAKFITGKPFSVKQQEKEAALAQKPKPATQPMIYPPYPNFPTNPNNPFIKYY